MTFFDTSDLYSDEIKLVLEQTKEADPSRNRAPAYSFSIVDMKGNQVGTCSLKLGYLPTLYYCGHIGYEVFEPYRGHHYAAKACKLLFPLAKKHGMDYLYITCLPENAPSRKTCEYLGGKLVEIATLPDDHDLRTEYGHSVECVYRFDL